MKHQAKAILITSAFPESEDNFISRQARAWITSKPDYCWRLVSDPEEAEMILFLEHHPGSDPLFLRVLLHPFRRRWPEKCWLFHDADKVFPLVPGVYPSLQKQYLQPGMLASWFYVTQFCVNPAIRYVPLTGRESFLYSFTGASRTHPVRPKILELRDSRAWLQDTSEKNGWELASDKQVSYHERYAQTLRESKFVLCPRGISPTSYRLLEAMKTGRAPVIISDEWPLPEGPKWNDFSIIVHQSNISNIPEILRERESEALALGCAARKAWEQYCTDDTKYAQLFEQFATMAKTRMNTLHLPVQYYLRTLNSKNGFRALFHSLRGYLKIR